MDKPDILNNTDYDFGIWKSSYDPNFVEISFKSRVPEKWLNFQKIVLSEKYKNSIIKPINPYAEALYPAPKLIDIDDNFIKLRQYTHAEVFILVNQKDRKFLDRPWMRQFYRSSYIANPDPECFDDTFVAYTPWVVDLACEVSFAVPEEDSAFKIFETTRHCVNISADIKYLEPFMIPFRFKKYGSHMADAEFGKVRKGSPLYDMVIPRNDIIDLGIKEFYAKD
jgi:hypothetical protein